jgi:D-alanyl-D-alanine carboxypeptidase (penicillin-binding protein 5/6)
MLLPSGNDAAYVLSAAVGRAISRDNDMSASDAVAAFISAVNDYAKSIGLCGTVITVPDGYAEAEHFTTTEDMAIIARLARENEIISRYASMAEANVVYASGQTNTWVNTNLLLDADSQYYSSCVTGLKTGSISGEYSLVFSFSFEDGREYIAGVFGADEKNTRFQDACAIIDYFEDLALT